MLKSAGAKDLLELVQTDFFADIELDQHQHRALQGGIGRHRLAWTGS